MNSFVNDALYDPTISIAFGLDNNLQEEPSTTTTTTPADAAASASLSAGAIAAIIVVPTIAVAVVLVFLFVPKVRTAIQPYFRGKPHWNAHEDIDTPITSSATKDSASHAKPHGWVRATTIHNS